MTRYLLDTNIISNITKPSPSPLLVEWLAEQNDADLFISTITLGEIWRGILEKDLGRKRRELEAWFAGPSGPPKMFAGRILPFDDGAALLWARLMADGVEAGRPRSALDMMVAAIAESHRCTIVTDNEKHFGMVTFLNPLRPPAGAEFRSS